MFLKGSRQNDDEGGGVVVVDAPDPGLGAGVEVLGGDACCLIDLLGVGEVLAGERLAAEEAPPAFLETLYVNSCAGSMSVSPESGVPLRREVIGMSILRPTSVHTHPATTPRP
jgi:hypothetical protein